jgi:protein O-mannosyl-transferase
LNLLSSKNVRYMFALGLMVAAVYSFGLFNGFAWDDVSLIKNNDGLKHFSNVANIFSDRYFDVSTEPSYRPFSILLYMALFKFFGGSAFSFHLSSLLIHVAVLLGVYLLFLKILKNNFFAFIGALIIGLHPVNSEAVLCPSFNKDLLACLGIVWLFVIKLYNPYDKKWGPGAYLGVFFFGLLALFSKETGLVFLMLALAYDLLFERENLFKAQAAKFYGIMLALTIFYLVVRFRVLVSPAHSGYYFGGTLFTNLMNIPKIVLSYLKLLVIPWPLTIEHTQKAYEAFNVRALSYCIILLFLGLSGFYLARKDKTLLFSFIWILAGILPVLNLVPFLHRTLLAERYMYLSTVGLALGVSRLLMKERLSKVFLISSLCLCGLLVFSREAQWKDEKTLYLHDLKVSPESFDINCVLAEVYVREKDYSRAIERYEKILVFEPTSKFKTNYVPYLNLSFLYVVTGQNRNAVGIAATGIAKLPEKVSELYANLAVAQYNLGDLENAISSNRQALAITETPQVWQNLGMCYFKKNDYENTLECLEKIKDRNYPYIDLYKTLNTVYLKTNRKDEAARMQGIVSELEKRPDRLEGMLLSWGELI